MQTFFTVADQDYAVDTPMRLVFFTNSSGNDTQCFEIEIIDDMVLEGRHAFTLELLHTSPSVVQIGMPSTASVTIIDDEGVYMYYCPSHIYFYCAMLINNK